MISENKNSLNCGSKKPVSNKIGFQMSDCKTVHNSKNIMDFFSIRTQSNAVKSPQKENFKENIDQVVPVELKESNSEVTKEDSQKQDQSKHSQISEEVIEIPKQILVNKYKQYIPTAEFIRKSINSKDKPQNIIKSNIPLCQDSPKEEVVLKNFEEFEKENQLIEIQKKGALIDTFFQPKSKSENPLNSLKAKMSSQINPNSKEHFPQLAKREDFFVKQEIVPSKDSSDTEDISFNCRRKKEMLSRELSSKDKQTLKPDIIKAPKKIKSKKRSRKKPKQKIVEIESEMSDGEIARIAKGEPCLYDKILLMKLPKLKKDLVSLKRNIVSKIESHKKFFFYEQQVKLKRIKSEVPENSVPICADVTSYQFKKVREAQKRLGGRQFDIIMMDPPWQLSTSQPSRGVAIAYSSLSDDLIGRLPVPDLQDSGFLLIWVINAKYSLACKMFQRWNYQLVDEIVWVKKTVTGKIAKGHGFYLQHAKETCLVGFKGDYFEFLAKRYCLSQNISLEHLERIKSEKREQILKEGLNVAKDVIFSQRRGQSQKPNEIYDMVETLVPNGFYLEIFGRRNNLHPNWVTIGNEL